MLEKIISGGQTGADIAALDAAISHNFPYGGWIPKGRRTLDGPLDEKYHLDEMPTQSYPKRTAQNVIASDGTVIFQRGALTGGSALTRKCAIKNDKPWLHLDLKKLSTNEAGKILQEWIKNNEIKILNVAGKSAKSDPKIYQLVYSVTSMVLDKCPHPCNP